MSKITKHVQYYCGCNWLTVSFDHKLKVNIVNPYICTYKINNSSCVHSSKHKQQLIGTVHTQTDVLKLYIISPCTMYESKITAHLAV